MISSQLFLRWCLRLSSSAKATFFGFVEGFRAGRAGATGVGDRTIRTGAGRTLQYSSSSRLILTARRERANDARHAFGRSPKAPRSQIAVKPQERRGGREDIIYHLFPLGCSWARDGRMEWFERLNVFYDVLQVLYAVIIVSCTLVVISRPLPYGLPRGRSVSVR